MRIDEARIDGTDLYSFWVLYSCNYSRCRTHYNLAGKSLRGILADESSLAKLIIRGSLGKEWRFASPMPFNELDKLRRAESQFRH